MTSNRMEASRLPASIVASVAMPKRRWSKRCVVISGCVVIRRFFRFEGAGGAKWSTNASACATPTMRISIVALGKAVRSAVKFWSPRDDQMYAENPINWPNIERRWKVNEVKSRALKMPSKGHF